jgi:hypothetical protein
MEIWVNTHFGKVEQLPFDIRLKRTLRYSLDEKTEPKNARDELQRDLERALRLVFEAAAESETAQRLGAYVSEVLGELVSFLYIAEQMGDRDLDPWFSEAQRRFDDNAVRFRTLAVPPEAQELTVIGDLRALGDYVDAIVDHRRGMGTQNWNEYLEKTRVAIDAARELFLKLIGTAPFGENSVRGAVGMIQTTSCTLASLALEAQQESRQERVSALGRTQTKSGARRRAAPTPLLL